jgi:hypothetical protein
MAPGDPRVAVLAFQYAEFYYFLSVAMVAGRTAVPLETLAGERPASTGSTVVSTVLGLHATTAARTLARPRLMSIGVQ